jgi:hypothetical protein
MVLDDPPGVLGPLGIGKLNAARGCEGFRDGLELKHGVDDTSLRKTFCRRALGPVDALGNGAVQKHLVQKKS